MMSNKERVREKIAEVLGHDLPVIADDVVLTDLVNSSFLLVEMVIELQEEFDVRFQQADMKEVSTVGQLLDLVDSRINGNASA
jgi:acyl carrier protein